MEKETDRCHWKAHFESIIHYLLLIVTLRRPTSENWKSSKLPNAREQNLWQQMSPSWLDPNQPTLRLLQGCQLLTFLGQTSQSNVEKRDVEPSMLELICLSAASTDPFGSSQNGSCKFGISKLDSKTGSLFAEETKCKAQRPVSVSKSSLFEKRAPKQAWKSESQVNCSLSSQLSACTSVPPQIYHRSARTDTLYSTPTHGLSRFERSKPGFSGQLLCRSFRDFGAVGACVKLSLSKLRRIRASKGMQRYSPSKSLLFHSRKWCFPKILPQTLGFPIDNNQ